MADQPQFNDPFYFAVPDGVPTAERERVPQNIRETFGVSGRIEFVRSEPGFRLYRIFQA